MNAVGLHEFIGFTEYPEFTTITTQYAPHGVIFTDGNEFVFESGNFHDGHGLVSSEGSIPGIMRMSFADERWEIGFDYNGRVQLDLLFHGEVIYSSETYTAGGLFGFIGFISTQPFDQAIVRDPFEELVIVDNIYFSPPVPSPGALALLAIGAVTALRRRRRS
jgi:MYXO-CTERM domain-containing protein